MVTLGTGFVTSDSRWGHAVTPPSFLGDRLRHLRVSLGTGFVTSDSRWGNAASLPSNVGDMLRQPLGLLGKMLRHL